VGAEQRRLSLDVALAPRILRRRGTRYAFKSDSCGSTSPLCPATCLRSCLGIVVDNFARCSRPSRSSSSRLDESRLCGRRLGHPPPQPFNSSINPTNHQPYHFPHPTQVPTQYSISGKFISSPWPITAEAPRGSANASAYHRSCADIPPVPSHDHDQQMKRSPDVLRCTLDLQVTAPCRSPPSTIYPRSPSPPFSQVSRWTLLCSCAADWGIKPLQKDFNCT
jgi:hypothetical protein